jgi:hypothetical protein
LLVLLATAFPALGQEVDLAIGFFNDGGSYCFRIAPAGVAMASETAWTVMVLTSRSNSRNQFRMREVLQGTTRLSKPELAMAGEAVTAVWRSDRDREEFFNRFAEGIVKGALRARVVKAGPANLGSLRSDLERANAYLDFAERRRSVDFSKAADLTADEFRKFLDHFPD